MWHTILVDFIDFVRNIQADIDSAPRSVSENDVKAAQAVIQTLFKKSAPPSEDKIAETFVNAINDLAMCQGYVAGLSRYRYQRNDPSRAKVDAALYREADARPGEGVPDWAHVRLYIEFKKGGTQLEPFEDDDPDHPEASAARRASVRAQLISYTHNVFLYQHRSAFYSLFINGKDFRILRWDRSGVIATKKHNYVKDPRPLLEFFAYFESLSDIQQGIDHTVTLLAPTSKAYKLMDDFAQANSSDMPHADKAEIPPLNAASSPPTPPTSPAPVIAHDRSMSADIPAAAVASHGPAFSTRQRTKQAAQMRLDTSALVDDSDHSEDDEGYLNEIEEPEGGLERPCYKIEVGEEKRPFLVGKPIFFSTSMFGRGTRGYVALDVKSRRFVFLKDSWRPFYVGVEPEGHYLDLLSSDKQVPIDVPKLVTHGDVADHHACTTLYAQHLQAKNLVKAARDDRSPTSSGPTHVAASPSHASSVAGTKRSFEADEGPAADAGAPAPPAEGEDPTESESCPFRQYRHYRVVVLDVCLPFTEIASSMQLIELIYHCITTHALAYRHYSVLHRDISADNVVIRPQLMEIPGRPGWHEVVWTGTLTDWELAKVVPKDGSKQVARQPERTGTGQFMSVAYVQDHPAPVTVADELESFFHVTLFYAVRLIRSNIANVEAFVVNYFDSHIPGGSRFGRVCSDAKTGVIRTGSLYAAKSPILFYLDGKEEHVELNTLLGKWLDFFRARYAVRDWNRLSASRARSGTAGALHVKLARSRGIRVLPANDGLVNVNKVGPSAKEPSAYDKRLAMALDHHTDVQNIFVEALTGQNLMTGETREALWPDDDAVADQLPKTYDPRESMLAIDHLAACTIDSAWSSHPHKRARTQASSSQPQAGPST
ncbi:hypothetical protein C8Q79DRAFT_1014041 [Trametes meyenii]|nr:hypothetical protein C8Q79DRAFT_1014041 [Trametes meyenii]